MRSGYTQALRQTGALNHVMMQTAKIMRMSGQELREYLAETAERNPFVDIKISEGRSVVQSDSWSGSEIPDDTRKSLYRHLADQFPLVFRSDADMQIALAFLQELDPNGWLVVSVEHLAKVYGFDVLDCERVLGLLQSLEPAGVFARDLKECLRLQAQDKGLLDDVMAALIDHLDHLANCELAVLARRINIDAQELALRLAQIRRMDPKPGQAFASDVVIQSANDVVVGVTDQGLSFELNRSSFPSIRMSFGSGVKWPGNAPLRTELRALVREAKALKSAVEMRKSSTLLVVAAICTRQREFLTKGFTALRPMRMGDVADDIDVSEATVSRIVSGLRIQCPFGSITAKSLFCCPVSHGDQSRTRHVVLQMIKSLIDAEDKRSPLNDCKITALLQKSGVDVSRRTITKYRHALGFEAPAMRRRNAELSHLIAGSPAARACRSGSPPQAGRDG